jgi:hypothetical protein
MDHCYFFCSWPQRLGIPLVDKRMFLERLNKVRVVKIATRNIFVRRFLNFFNKLLICWNWSDSHRRDWKVKVKFDGCKLLISPGCFWNRSWRAWYLERSHGYILRNRNFCSCWSCCFLVKRHSTGFWCEYSSLVPWKNLLSPCNVVNTNLKDHLFVTKGLRTLIVNNSSWPWSNA